MKFKLSCKIAVVAVSLAFLGALAFLLGVAVAVQPDTIISGVSILHCDLSELTRGMGNDRLLQLEKEILQSTSLIARHGSRVWRLRPEEIGVAVDRDRVLDEAMKIGRRGSVLQRLNEWRRAGKEGFRVPLYIKIDEARLEKKLKSIAAEIVVPPRDAQLKINPDETVEVVPSREGMAVDLDKACRDIREAFKNFGPSPEINLHLVKAGPRRTTRAVLDMGVNGLLSSYTTAFDAADTGRSFNIGVAAGALDGLLIPPGEAFSFNEVVGPRSSEAGYKNAKVIINNQYVDGLGGGVCQVSSTLYNAVLLANLEVLERSSHSLPVFYVPPGRDATVTFDQIDFRFRNSTPTYIYLKTLVGPGRLTVKIYGNSGCRREVTIRTRVVETIPFREIYQQDPALMEGETRVIRKGIPGMRVTAERLVLDKGAASVENLPTSFYRPVDEIILAGPGSEPAGGGLPQEGAGTDPVSRPAGEDGVLRSPSGPGTAETGTGGTTADASAGTGPERINPPENRKNPL